jgi:hypothetical protein
MSYVGWVKMDVSDPNSDEGLRPNQLQAPMWNALLELDARLSAVEAR